ncbi:hypothetical protein AOLI_G00239030 [Acnodon oligacanthus]
MNCAQARRKKKSHVLQPNLTLRNRTLNPIKRSILLAIYSILFYSPEELWPLHVHIGANDTQRLMLVPN